MVINFNKLLYLCARKHTGKDFEKLIDHHAWSAGPI